MKIKWNELTNTQRDALVGEHVMAWAMTTNPDGYFDSDKTRGYLHKTGYMIGKMRTHPSAPPGTPYLGTWKGFRPSTDIADAFEVIYNMEESGHRLTMYRRDCEDGDTRTFCAFNLMGGPVEPHEIPVGHYDTTDAICFAALEAMGHEVILPIEEE